MDPSDRPVATVLSDDGRLGLRYERRLAHPPEKVWRALTESEHLRHWMPCDLVGERRAGARLELPFWPDHVARYGIDEPTPEGEIVVWQPPAVFEWTWSTDVLRWELTPAGGGTHLTFTTWLGDGDPAGAAGAGAGYHVCLDALAELLDTGSAGPLVDAGTERWQAAYAEAVAGVAANDG